MSAIELLESARRAYDVGNTDRALSFYEQAREADPGDWEAAYYTTVLRLLDIRKGQLSDAIKLLMDVTRELIMQWVSAQASGRLGDEAQVQQHLFRVASFVDHFAQNIAVPNLDVFETPVIRHATLRLTFLTYRCLCVLAQGFGEATPAHRHIVDMTIAFLTGHLTDLYDPFESGLTMLNGDVADFIKDIHQTWPQEDVSALQELEEQLKKAKSRNTMKIVLILLAFLGFLAFPFIMVLLFG